MILYKLGSIWGKGAPDFYEMIKDKNISLSHIHDCNPKKNSIILITKGHTVKAITILLEDCHSVTDSPELKDSFDEFRISYNKETLFAKSKWIELKPEDYFLFKTQDGICQIHKPEIHRITKLLISKYMQNENLNQKIELLKYKKQIILQGPPGTGKTRLAKLIAEEITSNNEFEFMINTSEIISKKDINIDDIKLNLKIDDKIKSSNGSTLYVIKEIDDNSCIVRGDGRDVNDTIVFSTLMKHIEKPEDYPLGTGLNSQYRAVSNYILSKINNTSISRIDNDEKLNAITSTNEYVKLIQFHPAYSYEDFVRGITAKSNGVGIEYTTENKILAEFAKAAQLNYEKSLATENSLTHEEWIINIANEYLKKIEKELSVTGNDYIFANKSAYIKSVGEKSFIYNSKNYGGPGFEMSFKEFYSYCLDDRKKIIAWSSDTKFSNMAHIAEVGVPLIEDFWEFQDKQPSYTEISKIGINNYVLIIDEINRANLPSVLGELIYALEYRDEPVESMYEFEGKREIILPSNLFIIGTMNTADRSVGHIDYAIKRRFAFVDVLPTDQAIDDVVVDPALNAKAKSLYHKVASLFNEDTTKPIFLQSDFRSKDVQLGHSYFLVETEKQLELKLKYEIKPLLNEYVKDGILSEEALLQISNL